MSFVKYICGVIIIAIGLDFFVYHQLKQRYMNDQIMTVHMQAATIRARLEKNISKNLYIIQGLTKYISLNPALSYTDFKHYSREMQHDSDMLLSIEAAPDYVIKYVYPLKGNEALPGMDYRNSPDQWEECMLTESKGKMIVSGPVELPGGTRGFVGRSPVFIRDEVREHFWGIICAVIDADLLLLKSGINSDRSLRLAVRNMNEKGTTGKVFYGDPKLFAPEMGAIYMPVSIVSGNWQIAAVPRGGWDKIPPGANELHILISLLTIGFIFAIKKTFSKNEELEQAKENLNEAQSIARLGNWNMDLKTNEIWWSEETYRIFGLTEGEYIPSRKGFMELVHADDRSILENVYTDAMESGQHYSLDHRITRPDGELRYVSAHGRFEYDSDGQPVRFYGTVMDITERKMIEQELLESKIRFDHINRKLSNKFIFFSHTVYGNFIRLSEGFEKLGFGTVDEAIGCRWSDVIDLKPESMALAVSINDKVISGERDTAEYELAYISPDGEEKYMAVFGYMTHDSRLDDYVFEGVAIDITERRVREERLKALTRAIENAPVSVVITDIEGVVSYVNPYFCMETGYSKEEVLGHKPSILKSGKHSENFYMAMWETISSGKTWRGELINKRKDGALYWEYASISPVYNAKGSIVNYVAVKEDINDKKELERLKNDVDLIMRHDLKTPLNGIIGIPGLLNMDDNINENQRMLLKTIEDSGMNMLRMIDMSLDMFKMETGKYTYTPQQVDIIKIARSVFSQSSSVLSAQDVNARLCLNGTEATNDYSLKVWGEERLLYSLISGLFTNAVEASPKKATVTINFNNEDKMSLSICNKGTVPLNIRDVFFDKYVTEGKTAGTGLGTYSAKMMAETMNYKILMETSDADDETCIKIEIPELDSNSIQGAKHGRFR